MEIRNWAYDEFPEFTKEVEGAIRLHTTGEEPGVQLYHAVEYANVDKTALHLNIFCPDTRNERVTETKRIRPCIVHVQGSAWMEQDIYRETPQISNLAKRGYVVAVVEYRHSGIAPFPAQIIDTRNAVRFMRVHAAEYGVDPERIAVSGTSSGGHTAVFAGMRHNDNTKENLFPGVSAEVLGILNFYGATSIMREDANPTTLNHLLPDSPEGMEMGGVNLREREDLRRAMSADCNITEDTDIPPMLILHGTKDRLVNAAQSADLYRRLHECGKKAELYLIEGADHGGPEFWTEEVIDLIDSFLKKQCGM